LSSKADIQKVIEFFSFSYIYSLYGYKLEQYNMWFISLKKSSRYKNVNYLKSNDLN